MKNLKEKIILKKVIKKIYSNFTYGELIKSDTAIRLGIENIPNDNQWHCLEILVSKILQPVRNNFGRIRVTSGYRTPELCIAVGSSKNSNHTRGQAADIEPISAGIKLIDIMNWIDKNLEYRELIAENFPYGWVHVSYREGANNRQIKLKDKNHNYYKCDMKYINDIYK